MARLRASSFLRFATPVRSLAHRFPFLFLIVVAFTLIVVGRMESAFTERLRANIADIATPIVGLISQPITAARKLLGEISTLTTFREENNALRAELAVLRHSKLAMEQLAIENARLKALLNSVPDAAVRFVTARTLADSGSAFVRSVLVNAGAGDGLKKGDPVINGEGVVGRVVLVGEHASRVLLITDWNSRIPVVVESSREKAIMAGDNSSNPRLLYLSKEAVIALGDRIVTSGDGGVFPPGLPIGTVGSIGEEGARIQPFVTWSRLELVRIVDYSLEGALPPSPLHPSTVQGELPK